MRRAFVVLALVAGLMAMSVPAFAANCVNHSKKAGAGEARFRF